MSGRNLDFGRQGEETAIEFLKQNGYRILEINYKSKFGEIDIIAKEKNAICFVEVKARASCDFGLPQEAVAARKQRQISKSAIDFLKKNNLLNKEARFDVVSVLGEVEPFKLELIKNAFELPAEFTI